MTDKLAQAAAAEIDRIIPKGRHHDAEYLAVIIARHYAPLVEAAEAIVTDCIPDNLGRLRAALKGVRG